MKKFLLFAFITFLGVSSFANTAKTKAVDAKNVTPTRKDALIEKTLQSLTTSCKVSASWKNDRGRTVNLTVTASCNNCTRQQACDAAYRLISILIPGSFEVISENSYDELERTELGDIIPD